MKAIIDNARVAILFLWLQALIVLAGRLLQKIGTAPQSDLIANILISYGLGTGLLMGMLWGLGFLGLYSPWVLILFFLFLSVVVALANTDLWYCLAEKRKINFTVYSMTLSEKIFSTLLTGYVAVFFFHALGPEVSHDALVYHLAFPHLWLMSHRLHFPLTYVFSGMPLNTEVFYGLSLALSGELLAKLTNIGFGLVSAAAIYQIVRERASLINALLAVTIFLAPPLMALEFTRTATDLSAVFFGLMAGYALLAYLNQKACKTRWALLAGIFCGLGMGCKYPAWIVLPTLISAWLWQTRSWKPIPWLLSTATVVSSTCWLKNLILYHNPLYPFLCTVLHAPHSRLVNWDILQTHASRDFAAFFTLRGLAAYLLLPWTATMGRSTMGNYLGPALLASLPVLLLIWPRREDISFWRKFALLEWATVTLLAYMPRFWLPAIASLAVLIGLCAGELHAKRDKGWLSAIIIIISGFNLFWSHRYLMNLGGWEVTLGRLSRFQYLEKPHPDYEAPYYPEAMFINNHIPRNSSVLLLGEDRSYYLDRLWTGASFFDEHPFFDWANQADNEHQLYERLQREGLLWVLFNPAYLALRLPYWKNQLTPHGQDVLASFWIKHVQLAFNDVQVSGQDIRADAVLRILSALPPNVAPPPVIFSEILQLANRHKL